MNESPTDFDRGVLAMKGAAVAAVQSFERDWNRPWREQIIDLLTQTAASVRGGR